MKQQAQKQLAAGMRPIVYIVPLASDVAVTLERYAGQQNVKPETVIAEALRAYLGDA